MILWCTCVFILGTVVYLVTSAPSQAGSSRPQSPPQSHVQTSSTTPTAITTPLRDLPQCTKSNSLVINAFAFDCTTENTTLHYEYISSTNSAHELAQSYQLKNIPAGSTRFERSGTIEGKTRFIGLDTTTLIMVDITSDQSEDDLRIWWNQG